MTKAEKTGQQNAPKVSVELYKQEGAENYAVSISIGDLYYKTATYGNSMNAFDEARGYLDQLIENINREIRLPF